MRNRFLGVAALALLTAACGTNEQQRAATGGVTGVAIGALAGGPFGAIIGGAAGAVGGSLMPEDATTIARNALGKEHAAAERGLADAGLGGNPNARAPTEASGSSAPPEAQSTAAQSRSHARRVELVKEAQQKLKDDNLYEGHVDGIVGPLTRHALSEYQQQQGLKQTASLDRATREKLDLSHRGMSNSGATSGSSAPHGPMLSSDQIRGHLQDIGYTDVTNVQPIDASTYSAEASRNGAAYDLHVDARTGRVTDQRQASTSTGNNAGNAEGSGSSSDAAMPPQGSSTAPSGNGVPASPSPPTNSPAPSNTPANTPPPTGSGSTPNR